MVFYIGRQLLSWTSTSAHNGSEGMRARARASIVWRVFNVGKLPASLLLGADSTPLPAVKHTLVYVVAVVFFCQRARARSRLGS